MSARGPSARPFYAWTRAGAAAIVLAFFGVAAALPRHWVTSRARYDGDSAEPRYDLPLNGVALRRAGEILHRVGGTYYVYVRPYAPVLRGNINGALRLWTAPALPFAWATRPDWIFSYRTTRLLPPGMRAARVYSLGPGIQLVEVAR